MILISSCFNFGKSKPEDGDISTSVSVKSDLLERNYKQHIRMSIITQIFSIPRKHVLGLETIGYTLLSIPEDILLLPQHIFTGKFGRTT